MKFYLSSFKIGNEVRKLKELLPKNNPKVAYIPNAIDSFDLDEKDIIEESGIKLQEDFGLEVELVDLRNYFGKQNVLKRKLKQFGIIWVRGGNVFVLRRAMRLSGFDKILKELLDERELLYGGYSAGVVVLGPSLKGLELVDDASANPYGKESDVVWEGLNIIDYSIVPHYKSNHPESESINKVVKYLENNEMKFKALRDGEVIIIE